MTSTLKGRNHKRVLMGWMHVEPTNIQTFNETTFLATYASGILAEEIGVAIEKFKNYLGKPLVNTCDEVTTGQLTHVLEHTQHVSGMQIVVFNSRMDDMQSDSLQSVQSSYPSNVSSHQLIKDRLMCFAF